MLVVCPSSTVQAKGDNVGWTSGALLTAEEAAAKHAKETLEQEVYVMRCEQSQSESAFSAGAVGLDNACPYPQLICNGPLVAGFCI